MAQQILRPRYRSLLRVGLESSYLCQHRSLASIWRMLAPAAQLSQQSLPPHYSVRCLSDSKYFDKIKEPPRHWTEISSAQLISGIRDNGMLLLDTRTPEEVKETGLIPGATNIPLSELATALELSPDEFQSKYRIQKPLGFNPNMVATVAYCGDPSNNAEVVSILHTAGLFFGRCYPGGWDEYQRIKDIEDLSILRPWTDISYETLMSMIASRDIQLFDVRSLAEVETTGMMPSATHIPLAEVPDAFTLAPAEFKAKYGVDMPGKEDKDIVIHCLIGYRSLGALSVLWDAGFHSARHFPGGWAEYSARTHAQTTK